MVYQGHHGDLLPEENRILLAEFYLRHRESTATIVHEYAKMKAGKIMTRLWKHPEKLSDVSANQVLDYLVHFSNRKRGEFLNHSGHPIFFKQFLYFECWLFVYHLYVVVLKMFGHSNLNYKTSEFCMKAIFSWSLPLIPTRLLGRRGSKPNHWAELLTITHMVFSDVDFCSQNSRPLTIFVCFC